MTTVLLGVDPGFTGACCIKTGDRITFFDCPIYTKKVGKRNQTFTDVSALIQFFASLTADRIYAVLEDQNGRGMGSMGAFKYGHNFGVWQTLLKIYVHKTITVTPRDWTRDLRKDGGKEASLAMARELYPEVSAQHITRKKDNGRADALLLIHWYQNYA